LHDEHYPVSANLDVLQCSEWRNRPFGDVVAKSIKDLDTPIAPVKYVNPTAIECEGVRQIELARVLSLAPALKQKPSVRPELDDAIVSVTVTHIDGTVRGYRHIAGSVEMGRVIAGNSSFSQLQQKITVVRELEDLMKRHISNLDVVLRVHCDAVRQRQNVCAPFL